MIKESIKILIDGDVNLMANLLFVYHGLLDFTDEGSLKKLLSLKLIYREILEEEVFIKTVNLFDETDDEFVAKLRDIFGYKKTGVRGKASSKITVKLKIIQWKNDNPEYTNEDILKAAQYYIDNYHQISGGILQGLDNFIYVYINNDYVSKLSSVIDEAKETDEDGFY